MANHGTCFSNKHKCNKILDRVYRHRTPLIIGSSVASAMQSKQLDLNRMNSGELAKLRKRVAKHVEFSLKLFQIQSELGLWYVSEYPHDLSVVTQEILERFCSESESQIVQSNVSSFWSPNPEGQIRRINMCYLSNSPCVSRRIEYEWAH